MKLYWRTLSLYYHIKVRLFWFWHVTIMRRNLVSMAPVEHIREYIPTLVSSDDPLDGNAERISAAPESDGKS